MTLNSIIESKEYFQTLNEAIEKRRSFWQKNIKILETLKQDLFDYLDIEEFFIINEFLEKHTHLVDKIDILIELTNFQFEQLLDEKILDKYNTDNICFHIKTKNENYIKTDSFYKKENLTILCKKLIK